MLYEKTEFIIGSPIKIELLCLEEYPFHMHSDVLEIIYCVDGTLELTAVNNSIQLIEGDIYICSPNELHRLCKVSSENPTIMLIFINIDEFRDEFPNIDTYQFANGALANNSEGIKLLGSYIKKLIIKIFGERDNRQINLYETGSQILNILIKEFQCYYIGKYYPELSNVYKGNELQLSRIRRVVDHIYKNCYKQIKIEDVANMEHISTYHLTYILKIGCGMGFRMFLNMARVEKSAALLLEDEMSLQQVSYECGFSKYEYYNETFKKVFRMAPRQYKQKYLNKTINIQTPKYIDLNAEQIKILVKRFYVKNEEINLDLEIPYKYNKLNKPSCVNLISEQYDHITCYDLLVQLKMELDINTIAIDTSFLSKYKNKQDMLRVIFQDFWNLNCCIRVYVDDNCNVDELKVYTKIINKLELMQYKNSEKQFEFAIKTRENSDLQHSKELVNYFISQEIATCAIITESLIPTINIMHNSGCIPCYILNYLFEHNQMVDDKIIFKDRKDSVNSNKLTLFSSNGIKTPIYYLLYLLQRIGHHSIKQGNGYLITKSFYSKDFQVLIYNYNGYFDNLFNRTLVEETDVYSAELLKKDVGSSMEITFSVNNIFGKYALKVYKFMPEEYMKKNIELSVLIKRNLSNEAISLINRTLEPETSINILEINGNYNTKFRVEPSEILLYSFESI